MDQINGIGPLQQNGSIGNNQKLSSEKGDGTGFKDVLKNFMTDVNEMQTKADQSIQKMAAGEITDVHQVVTSVEEANVAFNMMMEIRNKVMDAYQEIMRIKL